MTKAKKTIVKSSFFDLKKTKIIKCALVIFALLMIIFSALFYNRTYSFWTTEIYGDSVNRMNYDCFGLEFNDLDTNGGFTSINLINTFPMNDVNGLSTKPYKISLQNNCNVPANYVVYLTQLESSESGVDNSLQSNFIKYQIIPSNQSSDSVSVLSSSIEQSLDAILSSDIEIANDAAIIKNFVIYNGLLNVNESTNLDLRLWVDYNATNDAMNRKFNGVITIVATPPN